MKKLDVLMVVGAAYLTIVAVFQQDSIRIIAWSCLLIFGLLSVLNKKNTLKIDLMGVSYIFLVISIIFVVISIGLNLSRFFS